jgi:hypothetical protein
MPPVVPDRQAGVVRGERSLGRQARLIAVVCLLVDFGVFVTTTPGMPVLPRVLVLVAIVAGRRYERRAGGPGGGRVHGGVAGTVMAA